jgi:hypothetical protein
MHRFTLPDFSERLASQVAYGLNRLEVLVTGDSLAIGKDHHPAAKATARNSPRWRHRRDLETVALASPAAVALDPGRPNPPGP